MKPVMYVDPLRKTRKFYGSNVIYPLIIMIIKVKKFKFP